MASGYRSKFFQTYASTVLPILYELEKERKHKCAIIYAIELFLIILLIFSVLFLIFPGSIIGGSSSDAGGSFWYMLLTPIIIVLSVIGILLIPPNSDKKFKTKVKDTCIAQMLAVFGDIQWPGHYLPVPLDIESSDLFSDYSKCKFDDVFTGCHNGVGFTVAETHLTKIVHTRKGSHEETVFKGIVLDFPFNKEVKSHTIITPKNDFNSGVVNVGMNITVAVIMLVALIFFVFVAPQVLFQNPDVAIYVLFAIISLIVAAIGAKKFKKVKLEDVIFDKDYNVASEDQVEARYLITPSFMERFKNLKKAYNSKYVKCALFDNQIMFAISTNKDLFEIGSLFHPLTDSRQIDGFFDEIIAILDIIEEFKLDENTGL